MIFDDRRCELGEGPLWHPLRKQLFWFDILNCKLLTHDESGPRDYVFPHLVSAAGWVDHETLLIAGENGLSTFDLTTKTLTPLLAVEADITANRSNDGRADPLGGFWFGTMGKRAEKGAGAIYRYYRGELRQLFRGLTIPNSICFPPSGAFAHFSDTAEGRVMKVSLDDDGWPNAEPQIFLDLNDEGLNPDGAVIDDERMLWLAQWGASRVACYSPEGRFVRSVHIDAPHSSCPAFGGSTLFCTTALQGMTPAERAANADAGKVFAIENVALGQSEHQVIL